MPPATLPIDAVHTASYVSITDSGRDPPDAGVPAHGRPEALIGPRDAPRTTVDTMTRTALLLCGGLFAVGLLSACDQSPEVPSRYDRTLGKTKESAPLPPPSVDLGILSDPQTYQPARPGAGAGGAVASADAQTQVANAVAALVKAIRDGYPDLALKLFRTEDVAELSAKQEDLSATFSALDRLSKAIQEKLGPGKADRPIAELYGLPMAEPRPNMLDAEHASASPNVTLVLFGPSRLTESMALALQDGAWKFRLATPLTAADVEAILAYHKKLQAVLEQISDWLDANAKLDEAEFETAIKQAVRGQPFVLGEPTTQPASQPATQPGAEEGTAEGGSGPGIIKP